MAPNPSPGFSPHDGRLNDLAVTSSRAAHLLAVANGEDYIGRDAVRETILRNSESLPQDFLEEAARSVRYGSIAQALLSTVGRMSYFARTALAEKFQKIGRDDGVLFALADSKIHDGTGLRLLCEASTRSRFIENTQVDLESSCFAASLEDVQAEVLWLRSYSKDRGFDRAVERLKDLAVTHRNADAYNALGEMLIQGEVISSDAGAARHCFRNAAVGGSDRAKLNLLQNFPEEVEGKLGTYFRDFYNNAYFPGLAWCYKRLRSEDVPLRHLETILTCYLWHPDLPVGTREGIAAAVRAAEQVPTQDRLAVADWAARNSILVMDGKFPAVRAG
jgi:hypothetical protein